MAVRLILLASGRYEWHVWRWKGDRCNVVGAVIVHISFWDYSVRFTGEGELLTEGFSHGSVVVQPEATEMAVNTVSTTSKDTKGKGVRTRGKCIRKIRTSLCNL